MFEKNIRKKVESSSWDKCADVISPLCNEKKIFLKKYLKKNIWKKVEIHHGTLLDLISLCATEKLYKAMHSSPDQAGEPPPWCIIERRDSFWHKSLIKYAM